MVRRLKIFGVVLGAIALSTLGISASDSLRGASGSLVSQLISHAPAPGCGEGSAEVSVDGKTLCVDLFEESPNESCPSQAPGTVMDSDRNLRAASCAPATLEGGMPWRYINLSQAQQACAKAGKRLMTNAEWYRAALGTPEEGACNLANAQAQGPETNAVSTCKSSAGMYNMVGNLWEWTDAKVANGEYDGIMLPEEGYVAGVDPDGVAASTTQAKDTLYGEDYFWESKEGVRAMVRGGFYGSGRDGGLFSLNAALDPSFASPGIGFRCARDL